MILATNTQSGERTLTVSIDDFANIAKSLASDLRISIFKLLLDGPKNVGEIAEIFSIPPSTAATNIKKLEEVNLIKTDMVPGTRGTQKLCTAIYSRIIVNTMMGSKTTNADKQIVIPMAIGNFFDYDIHPTCGILSEKGIIGEFDNPGAFSEPERMNAQLLWFHHGFIEYRFPKRVPPGSKISSIEVTAEVCSEAPLHANEWPSDITMWMNGVEIGTWTSPGDFGGQRGMMTPDWWLIQNTQYGLLKVWRVTQDGSYIDGVKISNTSVNDLKIGSIHSIPVHIGVKEDAQNVGGINIFGQHFGNYPTDITMRIELE